MTIHLAFPALLSSALLRRAELLGLQRGDEGASKGFQQFNNISLVVTTAWVTTERKIKQEDLRRENREAATTESLKMNSLTICGGVKK